MLKKSQQIKKFPFLGNSPNIMDYFAIIGYQENFFPKILDTWKKKYNEYAPTILSSITSNIDYGIVNNKLIISQIYPDNPIVLMKNNSEKIENQTSNVVYSFCFDSTDGKTKIFYVCFGFKFYEKYRYDITSEYYGEYYIPKAFCIISQYYYFSLFEYICKNIYDLFIRKEEEEIPIEIIIYNIVNFIPSPINYPLNLNIFNKKEEENIEIGQLSGYPYLDFDLKQIFDLLPLYFILEIYIYTILEQSIIFFSSNLEILNMVMIIFYILNYPCNDSTYFWHIVSVSKDNLVDENKFVSKIMDSMIGVNSTYNDKIDTSSFGKYHLIVDIDNKKIFSKQASRLSDIDEMQDYNKFRALSEYIQTIIKEKDKYVDSVFLKPFIDRLRKYLEIVLLENPAFNFYPKNKYVNFFKSSKEIIKQNKRIQELFYDFYLNILMIFYQDNILDSSFDKIKKDKLEDSYKRIKKLMNFDINSPMNENEINFCKFFRDTMKYRIYFENFIINFELVDIYTIPLYFSDEFINIKLRDESNKIINKISLFYIMDSFYDINKHQIQNINLNNFYSLFKDTKLKKIIKLSNNLKNNHLILLNKKLINKYIYFLKNNLKKQELNDLLSSVGSQIDNHILLFDKRNIHNIIQSKFEKKNFIDLSDYLTFSLVYIFAISLHLHTYLNMVNHLEKILSLLSETKLFLRQNICILIKSIYRFYLINKKEKIFPNVNFFSIKMYYYMLVNILIQKNIIPNEEMMIILNQIFGKLIHQENDVMEKEQINESNFKIEKNKNFLCFMKHCFTNKKIFKPKIMVKAAMNENNSCNIIVRGGIKQLHPTVEIKINEFSHSSYFFSPKKIYKIIQLTFNDFFDNEELDMNKLLIKNVRDVISNLILYATELTKYNKFLDFLIYTLYLFRNHEKIYGINENINIRNDEN